MLSSGGWSPRRSREPTGDCWPDLLRSKQRNLGRGGSAGKEKAGTDDFERGDWRYWSGKSQTRVTMEVMGRHVDQL